MKGFVNYMNILGYLSLLSLLFSCSKMGIRAEPFPEERWASVIIPYPLYTVRQQLEHHLKRKRVYEFSYVPKRNINEAYVHQKWMRGESLRYYLLEFDKRRPHLADWKVLWYLRRISKRRTKVQVQVLELIFAGPPDSRPLRSQNSSFAWYETEPDPLRASVEIKEFWKNQYRGHKLPPQLEQIWIPSLDGPPRSLVELYYPPYMLEPHRIF